MITHKEAIDLLEDIKDEHNQEKVDKVIELLDNGIWHKYPDEIPPQNNEYLFALKNEKSIGRMVRKKRGIR